MELELSIFLSCSVGFGCLLLPLSVALGVCCLWFLLVWLDQKTGQQDSLLRQLSAVNRQYLVPLHTPYPYLLSLTYLLSGSTNQTLRLVRLLRLLPYTYTHTYSLIYSISISDWRCVGFGIGTTPKDPDS